MVCIYIPYIIPVLHFVEKNIIILFSIKYGKWTLNDDIILGRKCSDLTLKTYKVNMRENKRCTCKQEESVSFLFVSCLEQVDWRRSAPHCFAEP